ncbi:MAG: hypothetical protein OZ928_21000 [Polyangiaceae bacterium]|nr:hypothetical protein [Polyangiaceae bacterium]
MISSKRRCTATLALALVSLSACDRSQAPAPLIDAPPTPRALTELRVELPPVAPTPKPTRPRRSKPAAAGGLSAMPFPVTINLPLPTIPAWPTVPAVDQPTVPPEPRPSQSEPRETSRVIVYGADWCSPCRNLKGSLRQRGVPFVFIDIDDKGAMSSTEGRLIAELPPDNRNGIPLTRVVQPNHQTTWIHGNDAARVETAYRGQ